MWSELPAEIQAHICSFLPPNEVACTVRLINRATASTFSSSHCVKVQLSQPVPHHSFAHQWRSGSDAWRTLNIWQRGRILALTAKTGLLDNLKVAFAGNGWMFECDVLAAAAAAGHLDICIWIFSWGCCSCGKALAAAAQHGHNAICEWLLAKGRHTSTHLAGALCCAARAGHISVVERLRRHVGPMGKYEYHEWNHLIAAAEGYDLPSLQELVRQMFQGFGLPSRPWAEVQTIAAAAASPTPDWREKVDWLAELGCALTPASCLDTARRPDGAERLAWLQEQGYVTAQGNLRLALYAARWGTLETLQYLLGGAEGGAGASAGGGGSGSGFEDASASWQGSGQSGEEEGRGEGWGRGQERGSATAAVAAGRGSTSNIPTAVVTDAPTATPTTTASTAIMTRSRSLGHSQHVERPRRIHGVQVGPTEEVMEEAAASPLPDWRAKVEWLEAQGYPRSAGAYRGASQLPDAAVRLDWLRRRGYPLCPTVLTAKHAGNCGNPAVVQFCMIAMGRQQMQQQMQQQQTQENEPQQEQELSTRRDSHQLGPSLPPLPMKAAAAAAVAPELPPESSALLPSSSSSSSSSSAAAAAAAAATAAAATAAAAAAAAATMPQPPSAVPAVADTAPVAAPPPCPYRDEMVRMANAVRRDVLTALHRYGVPAWVIGNPAESAGHLAVAEWLVGTLGPAAGRIGELEFDSAALLGDVRLLGWLRERGCRWGPSSMWVAARGGCVAAVEWLAEQGCALPVDGRPYVAAAVNGDLAMLSCLRRLGCPWGGKQTFTACVQNRPVVPLAALQWLVAEGCPVDWGAAVRAALQRGGKGGGPVLAWLQTEQRRRRVWWRAVLACACP